MRGWEVHAAQQGLKAWLRAQAIQSRIGVREDHPLVMLFVGLFKPGDCLVARENRRSAFQQRGLSTTAAHSTVSGHGCRRGLAGSPLSYRLPETFFLRSAHLFFIISDNRFLPAGVRRSRFFLV